MLRSSKIQCAAMRRSEENLTYPIGNSTYIQWAFETIHFERIILPVRQWLGNAIIMCDNFIWVSHIRN